MQLNTAYNFKIDNKILEIEHPIITEYTFFDICNLDGKIYLSGNLNNSESTTKADLSMIPKGTYQLFIISGGSVFSEKIIL